MLQGQSYLKGVGLMLQGQSYLKGVTLMLQGQRYLKGVGLMLQGQSYLKGVTLMLQGQSYLKGVGLMLQGQSYLKGNGDIHVMPMMQVKMGLPCFPVDRNGADRGPKVVRVVFMMFDKATGISKHQGLQVWIAGRLRLEGPPCEVRRLHPG